MSMLPPGVHPYDPSVPYAPGDNIDSNAPVPLDTAQATPPPNSRGFFPVDNLDALAVYERASRAWSGRTFTVTSDVESLIVARRQKGRKQVTLFVPVQTAAGAATLGVLIGESPDLSSTAAIPLFPGDSVTIPTEAPVYAAVLPGNTTGNLSVISTFNPPD